MRSLLLLCILTTIASAQQPAPKSPPKAPDKEDKLPPRPDTPIIKLEKAHTADPNNRAKLEAVWIALLKLENWYFIWRPDDGDGHPRVTIAEGKNLVQCFSDREQAAEVAEALGLDRSSAKALPVAKAARMLANFATDEIKETVWDMARVNQPMTMPLKNYPDIYSFFLKKKLP